MIVGIFIGSSKLDLFSDENIEVVSSIADSSDITSNSTDYSKSFTVPASDNNNAIFKHYYDADVDNTFDARTKVDGRIELDGLPFKSGKFVLEKVNVKKGLASSYSINFFGKLVSLKDKVKEDELSSLDFSDLTHTYNSNNVLNGLVNGLFDKKLVYNLLSKRRYYYNSDVADTTDTDTIANIATVGARWNDLKPSIKLIEIIKAIEVKYDLSFSRDFFGRTEFDSAYLWLNNKLEGTPQTEQLIDFTSGSSAGFNLATDTWDNTSSLAGVKSWKIIVNPIGDSVTTPYTIIVKNFGVIVNQIDATGFYEGSFVTVPFDAGSPLPFSYQFFIASNESMTYKADVLLRNRVGAFVTTDTIQALTEMNLSALFNVADNMPKIKIIDFLKAISQMFKLVIIQNNDSNIYINTLVDYYSQGKLYDVTKYIDIESNTVARGKLLNEINFLFEPPTTLLNLQFKENTGLAYGDEVTKLTDSDGEPLDGSKFEVKIPFEQFVYERLTDNTDGILTNIMYGLIADKELNPVNPKSHIFYNNIVTVGSKPIKLSTSFGGLSVINGIINTASHTLTFDLPQYSTIFSEEFNEWDGSIISNTLYSNYYQDYIESIFNIKRRSFNYKAILPLRLLLSLRLNDILKIKDNYFRIDDFTLNLTTGETDLNLINSFDNTINPFDVGSTIIFSDARQPSQTIYVKGYGAYSVAIEDVGFGTSWAGYSTNNRLITINLNENLMGLQRSINVKITSEGKEINLEIIQQAGTVSFDNTEITFDSTLITFDNA